MADLIHLPVGFRIPEGKQLAALCWQDAAHQLDRADLERRLRDLGWDITVTSTPGPFYWGIGGRQS